MKNSKTSVSLSLTAVAVTLILACQAEVVQDSRSVTTGGTAQSASGDNDATGGEVKKPDGTAGNPAGTPTPTPGGAPVAPAGYTMTWDVSPDPAVTAYKVFIVPPDRNPRFPGKTDVPIQIKNYPIAGLQKVGLKYSLVVSSDDIKAALGTTVVAPAAYCFTIVSVNAVGNSTHSPVICP